MIPTSLKKAVCGYDRNALALALFSSFVPRKGHVNAYIQERDRDTRVVLYPPTGFLRRRLPSAWDDQIDGV